MRSALWLWLGCALCGCVLDWRKEDTAVDPIETRDGGPLEPVEDASAPDAAVPVDAFTPDDPYAVATPGAPCATAQAETLACDGHASRKSLKCSQGTWVVFDTCEEDERCQTARGPLQGLCVGMPAECLGQVPELAFCSGTARKRCGIDLLDLADEACVEHAVCDPSAEGLCACDVGFEPDGQGACRIADDCAMAPCAHGTCVDGEASFICQCEAGYTGTLCEIDIDECAASSCQNGSTCVDGVNGYSCACQPGFTGGLCEVNIDDCASGPCLNGGSCADGINGYACTCAAGFSGAQCEVNEDDCAVRPCGVGTCIDQAGGYTCRCPSRFYFDGWSCVPIDDCGGPNGELCP